ncbi:MAG: hypothetical protein HQK65_18270, partial [Desulfamplus sp.]|nr:hypothetical protein [Desulfamplus sp.]
MPEESVPKNSILDETSREISSPRRPVQTDRPVIGITMGDSAGIGPEIIVSALDLPSIYQICRPVVLGDSGIMAKAVEMKNLSLQINKIRSPSEGLFSHGTIDLINLSRLGSDTIDIANLFRLGSDTIDQVNLFRLSSDT